MREKLKSARDTVMFLEDFGASREDAANENAMDAMMLLCGPRSVQLQTFPLAAQIDPCNISTGF